MTAERVIEMTKMQEDFGDFIGKKAFEDDDGWTWEVWQTAYVAALQRLEDRFKRLDDSWMHCDEIAAEIKGLKEMYATPKE
jgi:hypothetical protein